MSVTWIHSGLNEDGGLTRISGQIVLVPA
jgi:hypothetical protein